MIAPIFFKRTHDRHSSWGNKGRLRAKWDRSNSKQGESKTEREREKKRCFKYIMAHLLKCVLKCVFFYKHYKTKSNLLETSQNQSSDTVDHCGAERKHPCPVSLHFCHITTGNFSVFYQDFMWQMNTWLWCEAKMRYGFQNVSQNRNTKTWIMSWWVSTSGNRKFCQSLPICGNWCFQLVTPILN